MIRPYELLLCLCLIFLSGFLAAAEVSLFSLSRFQLRNLKEHFKTVYVQIKELLADSSGVLISILVAAEIINVSFASTVQKLILRNWSTGPSPIIDWLPGSWLAHTPGWFLQAAIGTLITTPILLIICEVTPKFMAARANHIIAPLTSTSLLGLYWILSPVRYLIKALFRVLRLEKSKKGKSKSGKTGSLLKEDEFLVMVEEGHKEGLVHSSELELIRNIFELDDTKVEQVCTPMSKVVSIPNSSNLSHALELFKTKKFSRMPIYQKEKSEIVGILYAKDLIPVRLSPQTQDQTVENTMRKALFIKQGSRLTHAFRIMRQHQMHMAVIQNSEGKSVGVVTMSDVLAEVFGEFFESGTTMNHGGDSR